MKQNFVIAVCAAALLGGCSQAPESGEDHAGMDHSGMDHSGEGSDHHGEPEITEAGREFIGLLVERFDVEACAGAQPLNAMKKTSPEGSEIARTYAVSPDCLDGVEAKMIGDGFEAGDEGVFTFSSEAGASETVTLDRPDATSEGDPIGSIQWELVTP